MNLSDILNLKPGRESDLLVCEYVKEWHWVEGDHEDVCGVEHPVWLLPGWMDPADVQPGEWTSYARDSEKGDNRQTIYGIPHYTDMDEAAIHLVNLIAKYGTLMIMSQAGIWHVGVKKGKNTTPTITHTSLALCLSRLALLLALNPAYLDEFECLTL